MVAVIVIVKIKRSNAHTKQCSYRPYSLGFIDGARNVMNRMTESGVIEACVLSRGCVILQPKRIILRHC